MKGRGATKIATAFVAATVAWSCGDLCGDEEIGSAISPGGSYVARAYVRNCGATTNYVTLVELANNRRWFRNATPIYVLDGTAEPTVAWQTATRLVIICDGCPPFPPDRRWDDVEVLYRRSSGKRS